MLLLSAYILSTTTPARTVSGIGFFDPNRNLWESIISESAGIIYKYALLLFIFPPIRIHFESRNHNVSHFLAPFAAGSQDHGYGAGCRFQVFAWLDHG